MANATYFKFVFVRHPMHRMLSCYVDKMINRRMNAGNKNSLRNGVHKTAQKIFQDRLMSSNDSESITLLANKRHLKVNLHIVFNYWYLNISCFLIIKIKRIIQSQSFQHLKSSSNSSSLQTYKVKLSFKMFILKSFSVFIIIGIQFGSHWVPYFRYCTPCSVKT